MSSIRLLFLSLIFSTSCSTLLAQNRSDREFGQTDRMDSTMQSPSIDYSRGKIIPVPIVSYSPETELLLGMGGLWTFTLDKKNPLVSRSSVPFSVSYSTNQSMMINVKAKLYGKDNKWNLGAVFWKKRMPDNYFGIGYDNGLNVPQTDSTTAYQRDWTDLYVPFVYRIVPNFYLGLNYNFNRTIASDMNARMTEDPFIVEQGNSIKGRGLGLNIRYDSRDFPENAFSGWLVEIQTTEYGNLFKSDFSYEAVLLDIRHFRQLFRERSTLAFQFKGRFASEDVPWSEMSQLGTPFDLRGYLWGRFRDQHMAFALMEYRLQFKSHKGPRKDGSEFSRLGVAGWVGGGALKNNESDFSPILPNGGAGLRFELQPRMNVRLDYGFGIETNAIYFSFTEAF